MKPLTIAADVIKLHQIASTREEAIRIAAQPLVDQKKITSGYVEAMLRVLEEMGTYMVISPGVAIAHARPSEDVKEDCVSLSIFSSGVMFGHEENDPVDIVFVIAATQTQNHLDAMKGIAKAMCRDDFMYTLRTAEDAVQLEKYFKGEENK